MKNIFLSPGLKSNHPNEACQHYYFSSQSLSSSILVAENTSSPCPFSGSYSLPGVVSHTQTEARLTRQNCTTFMQVKIIFSNVSIQFWPGEMWNLSDSFANSKYHFGKYFKTFQAGCSNSHSLEVKTQCEESGQKSSTNKQCRQSLRSQLSSIKSSVANCIHCFYFLNENTQQIVSSLQLASWILRNVIIVNGWRN